MISKKFYLSLIKFSVLIFAITSSFTAMSQYEDTYGGGVPNNIESMYGLSIGVDDSQLDSDGDSFSNACEVLYDISSNSSSEGPPNFENLDLDIWNDATTSPPSGFDCSSFGGGGSGDPVCNHPLSVSLVNSTITAVPLEINTSSDDVKDRTVVFYVFVRDTNNENYPCETTVPISFNGENFTATGETDGNDYTGIYTF